VLFAFADGLIKNFAITFGIGAVVSVISVLLFTRMFTTIILPIVNKKEKFIGFKRQAKLVAEEVEEA
jgi:preprotein translocase subunit SecD